MTRHALILALAGLAAGAPSLALAAGTPIDERRPLAADGRITIGNVAGLIEVQGWDRAEVVITGELGEGSKPLEISGNAASLQVQVRPEDDDVEETILRLKVPAGARVELDAVSADLVVQGVNGNVRAHSVSGDVNLGVGSAELEAQSVSGDLLVRAPSRQTRLHSVSGDIRVSGVRERLELETVSGDGHVSGSELTELRARSVSGDIAIEAAFKGAPKVDVESLSGNIRLQLPQEPDAALSLRTFSGTLESRWGGRIDEDERRFEAKLGGGRGRIVLNSFSGDIEVTGGR